MSIWFSAYLWGIETAPICSNVSPPAIVFSLPVRNWNLLRGYIFIIPFSCFQPTYEELKPCLPPSGPGVGPAFSAYLWGIETDISGLHQAFGPLFSAYLWGIETPLRSSAAIRGPLVFSLPMRNWNPSGRSPVFWMSLFSAYLWGIETYADRF